MTDERKPTKIGSTMLDVLGERSEFLLRVMLARNAVVASACKYCSCEIDRQMRDGVEQLLHGRMGDVASLVCTRPVKCPDCGHTWTPPTTRQLLDCPSCAQARADRFERAQREASAPIELQPVRKQRFGGGDDDE